jgi:hypothetical protein
MQHRMRNLESNHGLHDENGFISICAPRERRPQLAVSEAIAVLTAGNRKQCSRRLQDLASSTIGHFKLRPKFGGLKTV